MRLLLKLLHRDVLGLLLHLHRVLVVVTALRVTTADAESSLDKWIEGVNEMAILTEITQPSELKMSAVSGSCGHACRTRVLFGTSTASARRQQLWRLTRVASRTPQHGRIVRQNGTIGPQDVTTIDLLRGLLSVVWTKDSNDYAARKRTITVLVAKLLASTHPSNIVDAVGVLKALVQVYFRALSSVNSRMNVVAKPTFTTLTG